MNLKALVCKSNTRYPKIIKAEAHKLPICYSDKYNITAFGLEKLHPFDSTKYQKSKKH